jgi:NAD(P)-dependent dehydrogenase (short-subunit alcohol dehydrogenase family)
MPELEGKNVLITGALGTIGQALVARYAEEGANIIALDIPNAPDAQRILDKVAPDVRFFGCDLNDLTALESKATKQAIAARRRLRAESQKNRDNGPRSDRRAD